MPQDMQLASLGCQAVLSPLKSDAP